MNKESNKYKSLKKLLFGYYTRKDAESAFDYIEHDTEHAKADFDKISDEFWKNTGNLQSHNKEILASYRKEASDLLKNRSKNKHLVITFWRFTSVAALFILICSVGYWFLTKETTPDLRDLASQTLKDIEITENVQLTFSNEKTIILEGKEPAVQYSDSGAVIVSRKNKVEEAEKEEVEAVGINSIVVPMGKRSVLTLSDGSKMWVNSGSKVVFPAVFEKGKREIFVDGEIYIDVVPDKNRPFFVNTRDMNVRVLGTSFNVTAYSADQEQSVVLVQGSVYIKAGKEVEAKLVPNNRFSYQEGKWDLNSVNVNDYTSWKDGFYQYNSERIDAIVARLSRYYGITISCEEDVKNYTCSGKLDLKENITDVLHSLSKTAPVKYELINDEYIFKRK